MPFDLQRRLQRRAHLLMALRALAFILAWPLVIPRIIGFLDRIFPAFDMPQSTTGQILSTRGLILFETQLLLLAAALTALLLLTERDGGRRFGTLRFFTCRANLAGGSGWLLPVASGTLLGAAVFAVMMGGLLAAGGYEMSLSPAPAGAMLAETAKLALLFALVGLTEEFIYRAYLHRALEEAAGFWPATLLTSALFGVSHAAGIDTLAGAADTVLFGIFACLTLRATGNLWFAIGWHAGWDFTETAIFGTPNGGVNLATGLAHSIGTGAVWLTGGSAGPEASVACLGVDALLVIILLRQPSILGRERPNRVQGTGKASSSF